jgi:branched-chain amino acid transport system permease protein
MTELKPKNGAARIDVAKLRQVKWYHQPRWRRLVAMVVFGVMLGIITGTQSREGDLLYSLRNTFTGARLWVCVGILVALWALREFGQVLKTPLQGAGKGIGTATAPLKSFYAASGWNKALIGVVVVAAAAYLPSLLSLTWQQVIVDQMGVYLLLAIGLNVVVGWAGLLDLGFVAFYAIGAYSAAYWTGSLPVQPPMTLNPFLVIPIAVATCLLAGLILGAPTLRLRGDYLAIVTLGFHEIIYIVARNANGFTGGSRGIKTALPIPSIDFLGIKYTWDIAEPITFWWVILGMAVVLVLVFLRLEHSRIGRAWTAIREDEVAAAASGINTVRYKLLAFSIGASTSGLAGVVYATKVGTFTPENFPLLASILVLAYVIFGGMGSIAGVVVGTAVLTLLPHWMKDYVTPEDRYMYLGALLVLMMVYRPQGMVPSKRRQREIKLAESGVGGADATGGVGGSTT